MKAFAEKSRDNYNQIADEYDNSPDGKFTEKFKHFLLEDAQIKNNDKVLDIACGNGTLLKMFSGRYTINGYGVDISDKMIENARIKCPDMIFEVASCEHTSFEEQMFDVVTVCAAYHHFPNVKAFAKEASRIVKPKGLLYIADVYLPFIVRSIFNPFISLSKAGDVKLYSPKEICENFEAYGFEHISFKQEGNIQIIVLRKK